jgi:hypothetical protein
MFALDFLQKLASSTRTDLVPVPFQQQHCDYSTMKHASSLISSMEWMLRSLNGASRIVERRETHLPEAGRHAVRFGI